MRIWIHRMRISLIEHEYISIFLSKDSGQFNLPPYIQEYSWIWIRYQLDSDPWAKNMNGSIRIRFKCYGYNNWGFLSCASHLYLSFSEPPSLKEFFLDNDSHLWRLYHILSTVLLSGLSTVKMRDSQLSNIKCSAHRIWTILKSFYFICQFPRKTAAQYIYILCYRIHVVHFNDIIIYI